MSECLQSISHHCLLWFQEVSGLHPNDQFRRSRPRKAIQENKHINSISGAFDTPDDEDIRLVIKATNQAIDTLDDSDDSSLLKAELLRELGRWDMELICLFS